MNNEFNLDTVLLESTTDNFTATWTARDAVEGLQIFGGIGSGKTSGSGRFFALKYLSNGFGGLVLTAKHDEKELWQEYCRIAGRTDDLIIVEPGSKHYFNFLQYEASIAKDTQSLTLNLVEVLKTVISAKQEKSTSRANDPFWESALNMLLANTIDLCQLAYGTISVKLLHDIALTAPKPSGNSLSPSKDVEGDKNPTAFKLAFNAAMDKVKPQVDEWRSKQSKEFLKSLNDTTFTRAVEEAYPDVRMMAFIHNFFMDTYKGLADKTRSIIDFSLVSFLYNLLREPTYSMFCRYKSTFTPDDCLKGKVILINLPVKDYHQLGQDCQILFKYIWQRSMERRRVKENGRPVFLWADEAQHFLHEHDASYQATARSSRIATVYISQNLPNYYANMGGQHSEYKVKSFLGTLGTKLFHANADNETNKYASTLIGEAYVADKGATATMAGEFSSGKSISYKLEAILRPEQFVSLRTGGPNNNFRVEGVMHAQGKQLIEGFNHKKLQFNQDYNL